MPITEPDRREKIEVTEEMIGAGMLAYSTHSPLFESSEELVERVFRDMIAKARLEG